MVDTTRPRGAIILKVTAPCTKIVVWPRETKSIIQRQFLCKQPIINHSMHSYFNITLKTSLPPYVKGPCCTSYRYNANYHNHSITRVSLHPLNYPPCQRYRFADGYPRRYSNRICLIRLTAIPDWGRRVNSTTMNQGSQTGEFLIQAHSSILSLRLVLVSFLKAHISF